ncbi:MAG: hypothetical protein H6860_02050 [Rhodospirillales bacterium]|nr:hypothetical protein [Alphaproteobacteria bacterium]MCB9981164.1 hypothetical protein [Rhodospirillales bacterium]
MSARAFAMEHAVRHVNPAHCIDLDDLNDVKTLAEAVNAGKGKKVIVKLPSSIGERDKDTRIGLFLLPAAAWDDLGFIDLENRTTVGTDMKRRGLKYTLQHEELYHSDLRMALATDILAAATDNPGKNYKNAARGIVGPDGNYLFFMLPSTGDLFFHRSPYGMLNTKNMNFDRTPKPGTLKAVYDVVVGHVPARVLGPVGHKRPRTYATSVNGQIRREFDRAYKEQKAQEQIGQEQQLLNTIEQLSERALSGVKKSIYQSNSPNAPEYVLLSRQQVLSLMDEATKGVENSAYESDVGEGILNNVIKLKKVTSYVKMPPGKKNVLLMRVDDLKEIVRDALLVAHDRRDGRFIYIDEESVPKEPLRVCDTKLPEESYLSQQEVDRQLSIVSDFKFGVYRQQGDDARNILISVSGLERIFYELVAGEDADEGLRQEAAPVVEQLLEKAAGSLNFYSRGAGSSRSSNFFDLDIVTFRMICRTATKQKLSMFPDEPHAELVP